MDAVTKQPTEKQEPAQMYSEQPLQSAGEGLPAGYNQPFWTSASGSAPGGGQQLMGIPIPTNVSLNCPPGLEYLTAVDQMLVNRQTELPEALTNIQCFNMYKIVNALNQQVYFATEESEWIERLCYKSGHGFVMHIWDNFGREVMRVVSPIRYFPGCCWCADNEYLEVEAPVGQVVGRVKQTNSCVGAHYDIISPDDDILLKIRGPNCVCNNLCCFKNHDFNIYTPDLQENIGKIRKNRSGFIISFPLDLDVKAKATLFGALFHIDFDFFEFTE